MVNPTNFNTHPMTAYTAASPEAADAQKEAKEKGAATSVFSQVAPNQRTLFEIIDTIEKFIQIGEFDQAQELLMNDLIPDAVRERFIDLIIARSAASPNESQAVVKQSAATSSSSSSTTTSTTTSRAASSTSTAARTAAAAARVTQDVGLSKSEQELVLKKLEEAKDFMMQTLALAEQSALKTKNHSFMEKVIRIMFPIYGRMSTMDLEAYPPKPDYPLVMTELGSRLMMQSLNLIPQLKEKDQSIVALNFKSQHERLFFRFAEITEQVTQKQVLGDVAAFLKQQGHNPRNITLMKINGPSSQPQHTSNNPHLMTLTDFGQPRPRVTLTPQATLVLPSSSSSSSSSTTTGTTTTTTRSTTSNPSGGKTQGS